MPTLLPALTRRTSRPSGETPTTPAAKADGTSQATPTPSTPSTPVAMKPFRALSRLGASFFQRKASTTSIEEDASRRQRNSATAIVPPSGILLRRGSTEGSMLSSSLPTGDLRALIAKSRSARHLISQKSTIEAIAAEQTAPPAVNEDDTPTKGPDSHQVDELSPLMPRRPPGETSGRRPVLSKKKSASDSLTTARETLPQRSGSFRNLTTFDRSKTVEKHPPVASQGSSHSSRDSGGRAAAPSDSVTSVSDNGPPYSPQDVLEHHNTELTEFEKAEIAKFAKVYFFSSLAVKIQRYPDTTQGSDGSVNDPNAGQLDPTSKLHIDPPSKPAAVFNDGYDDERGDYLMVVQDHLAYRYEVLHALGSGSFGQVVCCVDHVSKAKVAVKVIRNRRKYTEQAMIEIRMLTQLQVPVKRRQSITSLVGPPVVDSHHTVQMLEHFYFRNHLCITFELLGMNLYDYLKMRFFQGMPMANIRVVTLQLLDAFAHLRRQHIIHCDLKPENVLIKHPLVCFGAGQGKSSIAYANVPVETVCLIDFGSSCLDSSPIYTYIQSRFYRSPEVILGHPYDTAIDMWSLGCVVVELHTGHPIFAGENETEQLMCMMEILGVPPPEYLAKCKRRKYFFQELQDAASGESGVVYKPLAFTNSRGRKRMPGTRDLVTILRSDDADFVAFVRKCFAWDPSDRLTPDAAIKEPWALKQEPLTEDDG